MLRVEEFATNVPTLVWEEWDADTQRLTAWVRIVRLHWSEVDLRFGRFASFSEHEQEFAVEIPFDNVPTNGSDPYFVYMSGMFSWIAESGSRWSVSIVAAWNPVAHHLTTPTKVRVSFRYLKEATSFALLYG